MLLKSRGDCSLLALVRQAQKSYYETYDMYLLKGALGACSPRKTLDFSASEALKSKVFLQLYFLQLYDCFTQIFPL